MRLTTVIIIASLMQVSAASFGQRVTLNQRKASIETVLKQIREQSGYSIIYDVKTLEKVSKVDVVVNNVTVEDAIKTTLNGLNLTYDIDGKIISIKKKEESFLDKIISKLATINVTGKVVDENGSPMPGASIWVKNSSQSAKTDVNGVFSLTNVDVKGILLISFLGYKVKEVVAASNLGVIKMELASKDLGEVEVVSTGYQTISKERTTGAYDVISAEELQKVPSNDILEKLEGKIPGVRIDVKNGNIQIRTVNTYSSNSQPLIVIDGFPMQPRGDEQRLTNRGTAVMSNGSILSSFNPSDIEQITFLKDAVATSIWGSRGSNGVIVIDTKKGKRGAAPTINVSATMGVSKAPKVSDLNWMTSAQYIDLELEMLDKNFLVDATTQSGYANNRYQTPNPSDVQEWYYKAKRNPAMKPQADAAIAAIAQRSNYDQIQKYLLRSAVNQQYNLSISGGGDHNTYYFSGNYNKDLPIFRSNSSENAFLTGNFTNDLFNKFIKLRMGFNYQGSVSWSNQAATDALSQYGQGLRPYDMLLDENGNPIRRSITMRPEVNDELVAKGYLPFTYSPIDELEYSKGKFTSQQIRLNTGITFNLGDWINLDVSGMYQRRNDKSINIDEVNSYAGRILVNTYTTINTNTNRPFYNLPYGGRYGLTEGGAYDYNVRALLNINRTFNQDHQLTALAGAEIRETNSTSSSVTRYGFDADAYSFGTINPTVSIPTMFGWSQSVGSNIGAIIQSKNRYLSYFSNAAYTFKGRYNLSASARFDDYTLLGLERSKRAKPFWSAGARWSMKQEAFMQQFRWLNALNLRVTYGTAGAVPLAGNNIPLLSLGTSDPATQLPTATITTAANRDLGWETTKTLNFGADINVLNNRLSLSADAYKKRSDGILVSQPFNATYGWSTIVFNSGKMKSSGIELGITGKPLETQDWGITSTFNFAYGKTEVTDSRYNITSASNLVGGSSTVNGYPAGATFVYRSAGLDTKGQTQIYDRNNTVISNTTNLTSAFDINDLKFVGLRTAPYHGGFFNNFRYKSFSFDVQATYYFGHVFLKPTVNNYPQFTGTFSGNLGRQEDLAYRWKVAGDEANTDVPGLSNINFNSFNRYRYSDSQVRKADNVRLQQISLGYTVPQKWLRKGLVKNIFLSANARNLGILWRANKDGIDPEYLNSNSNYYTLPPVTSYVFNVNVSF